MHHPSRPAPSQGIEKRLRRLRHLFNRVYRIDQRSRRHKIGRVGIQKVAIHELGGNSPLLREDSSSNSRPLLVNSPPRARLALSLRVKRSSLSPSPLPNSTRISHRYRSRTCNRACWKSSTTCAARQAKRSLYCEYAITRSGSSPWRRIRSKSVAWPWPFSQSRTFPHFSCPYSRRISSLVR